MCVLQLVGKAVHDSLPLCSGIDHVDLVVVFCCSSRSRYSYGTASLSPYSHLIKPPNDRGSPAVRDTCVCHTPAIVPLFKLLRLLIEMLCPSDRLALSSLA